MTDEAEAVREQYRKYVVGSVSRDPLVFSRARGCRVETIDGRTYLDFFPGWAVSGLGHCPPPVVAAIRRQAGRLIHVSNNYYHPWQGALAEKLSQVSFGGKVFFCNSGAEANEAALKLCRLYGKRSGGSRYTMISMENAFHGRTLATVTMTGQEKYSKPFEPLPSGFVTVPFNNLAAVRQAADAGAVAVILELVQGEGGINVAMPDFVQGLARLCEERDMLLVVDEVQTGFGRTGRMFAYQHFGITPHIMTLAKTMGGGYPIGAMVARPEIADLMTPGTHASTFGGNPLGCAASLAAIEMIERRGLLARAERYGGYLRRGLENLRKKFSCITEVRGIGLMLGFACDRQAAGLVALCREKGLLLNCTHGTVVRVMPPLTVSRKEISQALAVLEEALAEFQRMPCPGTS